MQTVDRDGFIRWSNGVILSFESGKGFVAPERDCIAAEEALLKGEKVAFTRGGKIVSYAQVKGDQFTEVIAEKGETR